MGKSTRKVKRILALFLVVLMSIDGFSAIVSENDGSAFVTKAEFEALKKSFANQVDNYNASIDGKLDGAIASYLAGIRLVSTTEENNLSYDVNGILSPRADNVDLNWSEGTMKLTVRNIGAYWGANNSDLGTNATKAWTTLDQDINGKEATDFYELGIVNVDRTSGFAEWNGQWRTHQITNATAWDITESNEMSGYDYKYLAPHQGFNPKSNISLYAPPTVSPTTNDGTLAWFAISTSTTDVNKGVILYGNFSNYTRIKYENSFANIICTPTSVNSGRFSNFDGFYDWCNDVDNSQGHTIVASMSEIFESGVSRSKQALTVDSRQTEYRTVDMDLNSNVYQNWVVRTNPYRLYKPYFGFCTTTTNYNQLWTSKYDNIVDALISYDSTTEFYIDKDNKKHLWISAGAPVIEVKEGEKVTITCEFDDDEDYDVWFKIGSFHKSTAVNDDGCIKPDNIFVGESSSTVKATVGSMSNSVKVAGGGPTEYSFECEKKGIVFMKWSKSGNSGAGGGLFLAPKTVKLTTSK